MKIGTRRFLELFNNELKAFVIAKGVGLNILKRFCFFAEESCEGPRSSVSFTGD